MKHAKVTPIYKTDDKLLVNNYRPISILPVFSKILEKLMHKRLMSFFIDKYNLICDNQYGFREKHSTYMAVLNILEQISAEMDKKKYSLGIFLDLSKAFDTIDHSRLLKKLENYGVRGNALNWFSSYLAARTQCVSIGLSVSESSIITCGVPQHAQGSVLGPALFIIYINDIVASSSLLKFILFADDTNLFASHNNLGELIKIVNNELEKVSNWLKINKLSLNIKKTHFVIFHFRQKRIDQVVNIKIDDKNIDQVTSTKFLGVIINENLTWSDHINVLLNKTNKSLGVIRKLSRTLPDDVLFTLYNTLIKPYLEYCNIAWATNNTVDFNNLSRMQKKAVRIITHSKWNSHSAPLFKEKGILTLRDMHTLQIAMFVYRATHDMLPSSFNYFFNLNMHIHEHHTRNYDDIHIIRCNTKLRSSCVKIYGAKIWNSIPVIIRTVQSIHIFKRKFKSHLLNMYF